MGRLLTLPAVGIQTGELMMARVRERKETQTRSHHASSLLACPRQLYYRFIGAEITNPMTEWRRMQLEASKESERNAIRELSQHDGVVILGEQPYVSTEYEPLAFELRGYIDVLCTIGDDRYLIEYKAPWGRGVTDCIRGTLQDAPRPKDRDLAQLWFYHRIERADHAQLVYKDRTSQALEATYEIAEVDGVLYWTRVIDGREPMWVEVPWGWDDILAKLVMVEQAIDEGVPPDRHEPVTGEEYTALLNQQRDKVVSKRVITHPVGYVCPECGHEYTKAQGRCKGCGKTDKEKTHWMCEYCDYQQLCWVGGTDD